MLDRLLDVGRRLRALRRARRRVLGAGLAHADGQECRRQALELRPVRLHVVHELALVALHMHRRRKDCACVMVQLQGRGELGDVV